MTPSPLADAGTADSGTLHLRAVEKRFGSQQVLQPLDLDIQDGEFFTLLGPSGCGKTTLLRIISGLERPDKGQVVLGGQDLTSAPPERRPFNMVFQSYALFPHLTVAENVGYGLKVAAASKQAIRERTSRMLDLVDLSHLASRRIEQLSGGQRQRIALARALVNEPDVLLLDEPLGALDLQLRKRLQEELRNIQRRIGTTFVYVTHDQEEALSLSDRIALMNGGRVEQVGDPRSIYDKPETEFVARFIGEANVVEAEVLSSAGSEAVVRFAGTGTVAEVSCARGLKFVPGQRVPLAIRPEHLELASSDQEAHFEGPIEQSTFVGTSVRHVFRSTEGQLRVAVAPELPSPDAQVRVRIRKGLGVIIASEGGSPSQLSSIEAGVAIL